MALDEGTGVSRPGQVAYADFLARKSQLGGGHGFEPLWLPDYLFDFQQHLVGWATRMGRAAIFADCGLGKSIIQLVWAQNVFRKTGKPVLVLAPLAVSAQTVREGEKFGIECGSSRDVRPAGPVTVTNYERLHHFDAGDYAGVVCDESSILKNFDGTRRKGLTEFMRRVPYRLLCTATAAPNDFVELGTSSESLGCLGHMDMLARFFKNDDKTLHLMGTKYGDLTQKGWRFKPHAEEPFWRWVCSWARACRKPSDLGGYDDSRFVLPELVIREHEVRTQTLAPGFLFALPAVTLEEQREEQRRTVRERCEKVAELASHKDPVITWCNLNSEGDLLAELVPGAVQVSGSDPDDFKEETFAAFAAGQVRALVTKPKIGAFGMNFQNCAHQTYFASYSFESWYQAVRRSWRFGQTRPVVVDIVTTGGSAGAMASLRRKADAAERMFSALVGYMNRYQRIGRSAYGETTLEVPSWL